MLPLFTTWFVSWFCCFLILFLFLVQSLTILIILVFQYILMKDMNNHFSKFS